MKLVHLGQLHRLPFGQSAPDTFKEIVVSNQIEIANYVRSHAKVPVFLEGATEDFDKTSSPTHDIVRRVFPYGLPYNVDNLNSIQRDYLYEFGSLKVLYYLGEIKKIHKTIHLEASEVIDRKILEGDWSLMGEAREKEAIACILEDTKIDRAGEVILVFGKAHDFSKLCKENGIGYETMASANEVVANTLAGKAVKKDDHLSSSIEIKEKKYWISKNLCFNVKRTSPGSFHPYSLTLLLEGNRKASITVTEKTLQKLLVNINEPQVLISLLRGMGHTANQIADSIIQEKKSDPKSADHASSASKTSKSTTKKNNQGNNANQNSLADTKMPDTKHGKPTNLGMNTSLFMCPSRTGIEPRPLRLESDHRGLFNSSETSASGSMILSIVTGGVIIGLLFLIAYLCQHQNTNKQSEDTRRMGPR